MPLYTEKLSLFSATSYFCSHKSSNKIQLKEIHQANEASKIKVFNSDGITLLETVEQNKINEESNHNKPPQVPPRRLQKHLSPPIRQPPTRPPPPPPPPPTQSAVTEERNSTEIKDIRQIPLLNSCNLHYEKCPSPELPLPPPPCTDSEVCLLDEPLPPPPDPSDIENMSGQSHGQNSLIYPKNSYMCYRSERKLGRHGFDGNYHRVSTAPSNFQEPCIKVPQNDMSPMSPSSWEQLHNIRQHGPTVIFHSDSIHGQFNNSEINKNCNSDFSVSPDNYSISSNTKDCSSSESLSANSVERTSSDQSLPTSTLSSISVPSVSLQLKNIEIGPCHDSQLAFSTKTNQESASSSQKITPTRLKEKVSEMHLESSSKLLQEHSNNSTNNINSICNSVLCTSNNDPTLCQAKNIVPENQVQSSEIEHHPQPVSTSVDIVPRISCATQTTDTPSLRRKVKTREELECEQLSLDFIDHCHDRTLKNLLVPLPDQKTMSDYMEGLLDIELETVGHPGQRLLSESTITNGSSSSENTKQEKQELLANSYYMTSESNAKLISRYSKNSAPSERSSKDIALMNKKENLVASIGRKLNKLRLEQISIREEMSQNDVLGQHVTACVEAVAKPNELEKYMLHVEELDKIINLLLSLSGRLARAQNALINLSEETSDEDKKLLESKRDKLSEQHEDARRLKESIDRRSHQVSTFLHQYLSKEEYADYDHFIKMKSKLLLEAREIEEKIKLGEEQLTTLCNGMNWQRWKH